MTESELRRLIERAFLGVTLSGGVSLRQADVMDNYGEGCTEEEFLELPSSENTSDWQRLSDDDLERYAYLAHMDSLGFRFYIPAFILSVLRGASSGSNVRISTLFSLCPEKDDSWDHRMMHYAALSEAQKSAIAEFLLWVADQSESERDRTRAALALKNYWSAYLRSRSAAEPDARANAE